MKRCLSIMAVFLMISGAAWTASDENIRFRAVDIYVDSGDMPLAAYQMELKVVEGDAKLVGIEGGEHEAFSDTPYYDPAALQGGRIILAAFDTGTDLPTGRTRVARVHMRVAGDTDATYSVKIKTAATRDGTEIEVSAEIAKGAGK
ncbi:MAG: hypothetical protein KGZ25_11550 [Planctomycetes bacterium]|nr:hypothetical protein [Planctomycetota bacterium]